MCSGRETECWWGKPCENVFGCVGCAECVGIKNNTFFPDVEKPGVTYAPGSGAIVLENKASGERARLY